MKTNITFRHTKGHHPELQDRANECAGNFSKYYDGIVSSNFEFINGTDKTVHITVHLSGSTIVAEHTTDDFHKSLHDASEKVIRQIKKHKDKVIVH